MKLKPDSLTETAALPRKAEALGAVGGQPVFLAPQTAKDVYEAGYERPYNALLRVVPETGQVRRIPLARSLTGAATLVDGVVHFVRSNGSVTAVSADSGKQLWQKTTDVETLSAPAVSATYKRVCFSNRFGRLLALDSRTGAEVWRTSALDDPGDKAQDTPPRVLLVKGRDRGDSRRHGLLPEPGRAHLTGRQVCIHHHWQATAGTRPGQAARAVREETSRASDCPCRRDRANRPHPGRCSPGCP
jgi:hypothetical protein